MSSSSPHPNRHARLVAGVCAAALAFAAPAFGWSSHKYFEAGLNSWQYAYTSGTASREWNKVWRPLGYYFGLAYTNGSWVYDSWSNPFVDERNAFNEYAVCLNNTEYWVSPVTLHDDSPISGRERVS